MLSKNLYTPSTKGIYIYLNRNNKYLARVSYPEGYQKSGQFHSLQDAEMFIKDILAIPQPIPADYIPMHHTELRLIPIV